MKDRGLFCTKPFRWLDVSLFPQRGSTYLCCPTWLPLSTGRFADDSMDEVWNGRNAQRIRASIHDGSFQFCTSSCPFLGSATGPVVRRSEIEDAEIAQIIESRATVMARGPVVVNAAFDRSCNLSCPTCRTERIVETDGADEVHRLQERIEEQALSSAKILYITGSGDAFGSPHFNRWLRHLNPADLETLEAIHLHTNALLWSDKMWRQIPERVRRLIRSCEISIDAATPETYARNRRGGRLETLLDNARLIKRERDTGHLEYVKIHMVVQSNNFTEIPAFVALGERFSADRIYFSRVANWGTFSRAEFRSRAVHRPEHPGHHRLLDVLADPALEDPRVDLGNLSALAPARRQSIARPGTRIGRLIESQIG
jgi:hypothetical protein